MALGSTAMFPTPSRFGGLVLALLILQGCSGSPTATEAGSTSTPTPTSSVVASTTTPPSVASTAAPAPPPGPGRLVTLADNDAGWLLIDGTSQWLSPECRLAIEADGGSFDIGEWGEIEQAAVSDTDRSCDEAAMAVLGQPAPDGLVDLAALGLARGINFAGDFEVEPRGDWGQPILDADFALAAEAGFDHVRLPVRWSSYTGPAPEFTIDPVFMAEVDRMVELALAQNLTIVVDVHHFEELDVDPAGERARYLAIWEQLAEHYADQPSAVVFELLNEPIGVFSDEPEVWNELAAEALAIVRQSNPARAVIIGPVSYNHADRLDDLRLPDDPNVIVTIHTYDPEPFTVQGAVFVDPIPATGVVWRADNASVAFGWQQQSWDLVSKPTVGAIVIDWNQTFGAFAVGALNTPVEYETVEIEALVPFEAAVLCNYENGTGQEAEVTWAATVGTADISGCGSLTSLALQHVGGDLGPTELQRFAACAETCEELIVSQYEALDDLISGAAQWAATAGVGLYVGEFGTYNPIDEPTDPESRFAWTNAVRTITERNGGGWAYFAMNDEFGAFNRATNAWITEIIDALID